MREEKEEFPDEERENRLVNRYEKMRREGIVRYLDVSDYEEIIDAYLDKGQFDKAEQTVRLALRQHPSAFSLILKKADIYLSRGDHVLALQVLDPLTRLDPNNYEVFLMRGFALSRLKKTKEAIRDFEKALALGAGMEGDIAFQAGSELEMMGYYKEALRFMALAYDRNPFDIQAMFELAFLYQQTGHEDKSIKIYERYLREEPFDEGAWNNLGEVYLAAGNYKKALEAFDFQLAIHPASPDGLFNRGRALVYLERYAEAIGMMRAYLEKNPEDVEAMLLLGECYHLTGEHQRALSWYKVAAGENPDDPEPCYRAAQLYRQMNMLREAEACVLRSLEIAPENTAFNYELFLIWEETHPPRERLDLIRGLTQREPGEVLFWLDYITLLYEMRERHEVESAFEDAFKYCDDDPLLLYLRGTIFFLEGKNMEGEKYFELALRKNPDGLKIFLERFPQLSRIRKVNELIGYFKKK